MTKEQLQGMLSEGLNLNQIAAIYMISKESLVMLLSEEVVEATPTGTSGKSKVKQTEYQGTSGAAGTTGWLNEENI